MSPETDANQDLTIADLPIYLAIAGHINAQPLKVAKELDDDRTIYLAYSVLDSLSSSYSMFKYLFDILLAPNASANELHDMMMEPEWIAFIVFESLFLVAFSYWATYFEQESKKIKVNQIKPDSNFKESSNDLTTEQKIKVFIASAWPYFRDVMKALKNAYKGWRSTAGLFKLIQGINLTSYIVPVGLGLGLLASINRFMLREIFESRKIKLAVNKKILEEIKGKDKLTEINIEQYLDKIQSQSEEECNRAFWGAAAGGLVDGLYLYVGVLSMAVLVPQVAIALVIICAAYTVACMIVRVYEEHEYQLKLRVTATECRLHIKLNEIETSYQRLLELKQKLNQKLKQKETIDEEEYAEIKNLEASIFEQVGEFDEIRVTLEQQTTRSLFSAILLGLKNGLYAYQALSSLIFVVGGIFALASIPCPPLLLMIAVPMGLVLIAGFITHSVLEHKWHQEKKAELELENSQSPYNKLKIKRQEITVNQEEENALWQSETFLSDLKDGLKLDRSPQFFYSESFEVVRSFFSGVSKGQKFIEFAGNPLQEQDDNGEYHDSSLMLVLVGIGALFFSVVLALRALAKGFGDLPAVEANTTMAVTLDANEAPTQQAPPADLPPPDQPPPSPKGPQPDIIPTPHEAPQILQDTPAFEAPELPLDLQITQPTEAEKILQSPQVATTPQVTEAPKSTEIIQINNSPKSSSEPELEELNSRTIKRRSSSASVIERNRFFAGTTQQGPGSPGMARPQSSISLSTIIPTTPHLTLA